MTRARNLSRSDAERRASLLDVASYDVTVDLTDGAGGPGLDSFRTTTIIRFDCAEPGTETVVDVAASKIHSATLNGTAVDTGDWASDAGLPVPGLALQNVLTIEADFCYESQGRGMHRTVDPADGQVYLYTSFEPASAQRVFACFDQPDLKATFTFHVRTPAGWRAISNMPATTQETDGHTSTVHFATSPRMSTYITAICAGPYAEVRSTENGRDLGVFCRPSLLPHLDADNVFDLTRRGMDFYERHFGQPYPLPKYDHVAVPEYPGAMENFGCIVFGEQYLIFRSAPTDADLLLRGMIILHELAHMWFGDLVTMRWWDDLWLNEAFATWASFWCMAEATDLPEPWATFAVAYKNVGIKADQLSSTHPVYADLPDVEATQTNFDAITYRKGASVLKQLAAYVGVDAFASALRGYFAARAWENATFEDLVDALATASGRPVREFAAQWLQTAGVNTLRPQWSAGADGRYQRVAVLQEAPPEHATLRTHRLDIGLYDLAGDRLVCRNRLQIEASGAETEVPELRGVPIADVMLLNDGDLAYAKVRLDDRALATVVEHIHQFDSALPRAICWAAAADMVYDAEMATRDFLAMVRVGLPAERDTGLVTSVLSEGTRALDYFADPSWAPAGWSDLAATCRDCAYLAEPGGSLQLTWVRAFASAARAPEHLSLLKAWYEGTDLPEGVRLDPDLRWLMLHGLVAWGAADADEIERWAAEDRSVNGLREAAVGRALIPTVEAKARAWQTAVEGVNEPIDVRLGAISGYVHPAHTEFTGSHVATYLSLLDIIWHEQGDEMARRFARLAFPAAHVSAETADAVAAWCAADGHPPSLVRIVTDGHDQMVRAVAARARDAHPS